MEGDFRDRSMSLDVVYLFVHRCSARDQSVCSRSSAVEGGLNDRSTREPSSVDIESFGATGWLARRDLDDSGIVITSHLFVSSSGSGLRAAGLGKDQL